MLEDDIMEDSTTTSANRSSTSTEGFGDLDWDGLLEACREKEEQLNLAGACGLKLHEQLMETQAHIDDMRSQHDQEIERLVQETYELKNKLEVKEKALRTHEIDFEEYQRQINVNHEREMEELQENTKKDLRAMKKEKDSVLSDLEQVQLRDQQSTEQIKTLKKRIQDLQSENMQRVKVETNQSEEELYQTKEKNMMLEEIISESQQKLSELQTKSQSLALELSTKTKETSELRTELEEVEMRCTTYFNHLQQAREEKTEIKTELDLLKAETRNSSHSKRGNSLFSEVEDKRVEMEKKLLTMQVKYDSLLKAYNFVKNQLHNMKNQVYALLQVKNARADEDHISRLERALSQSKSENAMLRNKLTASENKQNVSKEDLAMLASNLPEFRNSKDLVDFLYSQIEEHKSKLEKLQKEYDQIFMVKIAESDKLHNAEQRLYETTARADSSGQANMRLKLKLEETKNRLESEIQKRKLMEKRFNYDSTNDIVPEGEIKECKRVEKNPLPFTLRKAAEEKGGSTVPSANNNIHKTKKGESSDKTRLNSRTSRESFTAGMQWHKLPKEILTQLGIQQPTAAENQENTPLSPKQISNPRHHSSTTLTTPPKSNRSSSLSSTSPDDADVADKPRRVSFKDTPEKIPLKELTVQETVNEDPLSSTVNDDDVMITSPLKEEIKPPSDEQHSSKKIVSKLKSYKRVSSSPLKENNRGGKNTPSLSSINNDDQGVVGSNNVLDAEAEEDANCKVQ